MNIHQRSSLDELHLTGDDSPPGGMQFFSVMCCVHMLIYLIVSYISVIRRGVNGHRCISVPVIGLNKESRLIGLSGHYEAHGGQ